MLERNELMRQRLSKVEALRQLQGGVAYPNDFRPSHTCAEALQWFATEPERAQPFMPDLPGVEKRPDGRYLPSTSVRLAGRVLSVNVKGKVAFVHLQDRSAAFVPSLRAADAMLGQREDARDSATFQVFFSRAADEATFDKLFKATPDAQWDGPLLDVGDLIGVHGHLFRTRTGEPSVDAARDGDGPALRVLTKAIRPLPEKWHGLSDKETRHRQRYVDLVMNDTVRQVAHRRSATLRAIRDHFDRHGYLEVETPMMHPIAGGATARPFRTHHHALDMPLFLRIAPELYLKRLVVGGLERVYEINRNFRNEGLSQRHNPEFTMLEFYRAYATWAGIMEEVEDLLSGVAVAVTGGTAVPYGVDAQGQPRTLSFAKPFRRVTIRDGLRQWAGLEVPEIDDVQALRRRAQELGLELAKHAELGHMQVEIFEHVAQPHLFQPTFVMEYPAVTSPLARRSDANQGLVDRFELFAAHMEISNAFSELNDPVDQHQRFVAQMQQKAAGDQEAMEMDLDYVRALEYGMPPTGGCGIGVDRLVMLLTNTDSIREVILFPHMRPERQAEREVSGQ
jgi:lysyl-tRNA synthetase class 2